MPAPIKLKKLPRRFYEREVVDVARGLLGKIFIKKAKDVLYSGRIVEVEAYDGSFDEAAHTFIGKTPRNEVMFGRGGFLYVYFTYGMYFCCNVVAGKKEEGKAVLIRALEPLHGIHEMSINRFGHPVISQKEFLNLTSGPGKVCKALNISRIENGTDLLGSDIYIMDDKTNYEEDIVTALRIGIKKSVDLPWRFYIKENPFVSKK